MRFSNAIIGGLALGSFGGVAAAVDYTIPSSWTVPTVNASYPALRDRAQKAINVLRNEWWNDMSKFDFGWGSGTTLSALPYKDMVASTRDNHDFVKKVLAAAKKHNSNFDPYGYNDDAMWWGTAAMYAHRAYGDAEFLQYAKDVWERVHKSQVTAAQAKAGKSPVRAQKIKSTCGGDSVAGAVFWRSESSEKTDMSTNVITTSLFGTLSVYLAEATKTNKGKYVDAAKASFTFITKVLFLESPNIPTDGISLKDCKANNWVFSYDSGKFVEGLFGLSALTKDAKYRNQALRTVVDGIKKTKNWNNLSKGYITEGQSGDPAKGNDGRQFKAIYVRALTEVYRREYKNAGLRKLIKAYLNINYNQLVSKATDKKGHYGLKWQGPFDGAHLSSQMNALDLLNAGIELNWKR